MAKQNSVLKVKGNLDGVSYYERGNKLLARRAKGPSKQTIKTNPAFIRTRENMSEFGGAIAAGKSFRQAFPAALKSMADGRLSNRLTSLFKQMGNRDIISIRGKRSMLLSENRESMDKFEFNIKTRFTSVCTPAYNATVNANKNEGTIKIAAFDPSQHAVFPPGTDYCRLVQAIGVFSNHKFNEENGKYFPVNETINGMGAMAVTEMLSMDAQPVDILLNVTLPDSPVLDAESSLIQCLGIEFYKRIGNKDYLYAQNNAMVVVKVW
jgi:hypothetical protein